MVAGLIYRGQWEALDRYRVTFRRTSSDGRAVHPSAPACALRSASHGNEGTGTGSCSSTGGGGGIATVRVDDCQR
jgi:hypothetical protein